MSKYVGVGLKSTNHQLASTSLNDKGNGRKPLTPSPDEGGNTNCIQYWYQKGVSTFKFYELKMENLLRLRAQDGGELKQAMVP